MTQASPPQSTTSGDVPAAPRAPGFRYYDLLLGGMVAVLLCSNLIGPAKVCTVTLPLLGALSFGAGNLFFPISYIFGDVLTEVRALRQDVNQVEAGLKKLNQQRTATGERRRENIKTALAGNGCAVAPVPVAGADSLYQRAEEVSTADYSGTLTRKPDGKN